MSLLPDDTQPRTRQELYDLIRQSSKEEFILNDMIRLGFWNKAEGQPSLPEQIIRREGELSRELSALLTEKRRVEDQQAMLKALRKQRMAESKAKQAETKRRRHLQREQKAEAWQQRKTTHLHYLGEKISGGLNIITPDAERLALHQLPLLTDALSFASALQLTVGELRFLAFNRPVSKTSHYKRFYLAKKTGGHRLIAAPMPRLKKVQTWILKNILEKIKLHGAVHGFVADRSILSNALPHVGAALVVNMDLKNFFPTLTFPRIKGVFQALGYAEATATLLALLCTEAETDAVALDGQTWYVASGERFLPQGSPASPALTNIICYAMDRRLLGISKKMGFAYTRYADDLTFSGSTEALKNVNKLTSLVSKIVEDEGFVVHPDKTRIMRKGSRKEVTGIVVNEKPGIERQKLRRFRALLHQLEQEGPAGKTWGHSPDLLASIEGFANFVLMVDAEKGKKFKSHISQIVAKWGSAFSSTPRRVFPKTQKQKPPQVLEMPVQAVENQTVIPHALLPETENKDTPPAVLPETDTKEPTPEKKTYWKNWKKS